MMDALRDIRAGKTIPETRPARLVNPGTVSCKRVERPGQLSTMVDAAYADAYRESVAAFRRQGEKRVMPTIDLHSHAEPREPQKPTVSHDAHERRLQTASIREADEYIVTPTMREALDRARRKVMGE